MAFDFFGPTRKAVIAMAHIGALPGTPLNDALGGMERLAADRLKRFIDVVHRLG
jgi:hypothetical protein